MFPIYFVASTSLPMLGGSIPYQLIVSAFISWALIFGLPTMISVYRRHDMRATYLLSPGRVSTIFIGIPAMLLLGVSLWMISHELMMSASNWGWQR